LLLFQDVLENVPSEFESRENLSSLETSQFIGGSEERPVSIACIYFISLPNASSRESNPVTEPKIPNHGVHK